jgi:hypothetical protein
LAEENGGHLKTTLIYKLGFDSSGAHEIPQQPSAEGDHRQVKHLMASQLVPLQLVSEEGTERKIFYTFPCPNSPHSCRPVRLAYERETKETINKEYDCLREEMENLVELKIHQDPVITVSFQGLFTLVDGKVVSDITGISSACCPQCGKGRNDLRNKDAIFEPIHKNLQFGCSILHFGLRTFELLLKIGYKQKDKVFLAHEAKIDAQVLRDRINKSELQVKKRFRDELGLIVDKARSGGFGSTNTGNVARKAFANPVITSSIVGVSTLLVSNIATIWRTLASGKKNKLSTIKKYMHCVKPE